MIHVCFVLQDKTGRYSKITGTSILSMFENHLQPSSITVHILHDNTLTEDNRDKFSYIAGRYGQIIKFYNVEKICAKEIACIKQMFANYTQESMFSISKFFKFMIPFALSESIEKIIYLDADTIVNLDILELWQIPIGDKSLAAVPEITNGIDTLEKFISCQKGLVAPENYFNSGVMVMNLQKIRRSEIERIWDGIKYRAENPKYTFWDQEIFNYCFTKDLLKLDNKFNIFPLKCREKGDFQLSNRLFHYVSNVLDFDLSDSFNLLWFSYFEKTPFFNKKIIANISRIYRNFLNQNDARLKNIALQVSALMSGKIRAFFIVEPDVETMKKIFFIKEDEEIIPYVGQESLNALVQSMKESKDKKVYFMFLGQYRQLRSQLTDYGFVEGRDFVNAAIFLSDANGVPLNTYDLVKAM